MLNIVCRAVAALGVIAGGQSRCQRILFYGQHLGLRAGFGQGFPDNLLVCHAIAVRALHNQKQFMHAVLGSDSRLDIIMDGAAICTRQLMRLDLSMGLTAENVARKYGVSREDADAFALRSHTLAIAAQQAGKFAEDGIVPLAVEIRDAENVERFTFDKDEGPRADTNPAALAKLKPVFHAKGVVTAGNSSQTSDGAAAVIVMSRKRAEELGLKPLTRFVSYAVGGVPPEIMGMGPVVAVPKALKLAGLKLEDMDVIELNEAFAAQGLAVMRQLGLADEDPRVNPNGGAIALGHPLGMSGARLLLTATEELQRTGGRYALCTMCIGVGQGIASVIERV